MISIIIPVHERHAYLAECIESVLYQKGLYEIIIVKSGNSEIVNQILSSYGELIRVIETEKNNIAHKINLGIKHAKGEWIKTLSSDDLLLPRCLEVFSKCTDECKYYYSNFYYCNQFGMITNNITSKSLVAGYFHKSLVEKTGPFDESVKYEDKEFIERFNESNSVHINHFTVKYRQHDEQLTKVFQT